MRPHHVDARSAEGGLRQVAGPGVPDRAQRIGPARAAEGADGLVQPPLHALHRVVRVARLRQLLGGQAVEQDGVDIAVAGGAEHAVDDRLGHARRSRRTRS